MDLGPAHADFPIGPPDASGEVDLRRGLSQDGRRIGLSGGKPASAMVETGAAALEVSADALGPAISRSDPPAVARKNERRYATLAKAPLDQRLKKGPKTRMSL